MRQAILKRETGGAGARRIAQAPTGVWLLGRRAKQTMRYVAARYEKLAERLEEESG